MNTIYEKCTLCPRQCNVNRYNTKGYCGATAETVVAKAYLHQWEEPCISYKNGAGTVFFSGCSLHCVYCQNNAISSELKGRVLNTNELADIFLSLQDKGADNIDLVTPTHFVPEIIKALDKVKPKLNIPVVYNCGGYEMTQTIDMLNGYIDIYLPDIKYYSSDVSKMYSSAENYFEYTSKAVISMTKQVGKLIRNNDGGLLKGTIIRHLVLPKQRHDSMKILDWISENLSNDNILVSIMNQYTPFDFIPSAYPELQRRVTKMEYNSVVDHAAKLGLNGFTQQKSSAAEKYVPDFNIFDF